MNNFDPIDVIEAWDLNYHLGSAVQHIFESRSGGATSLQKAIAHLTRAAVRLIPPSPPPGEKDAYAEFIVEAPTTVENVSNFPDVVEAPMTVAEKFLKQYPEVLKQPIAAKEKALKPKPKAGAKRHKTWVDQFAKFFKDLLASAKMSQKDLAELLGVSRASLCAWVSKDIVPPATRWAQLEEVGKAWDVDLGLTPLQRELITKSERQKDRDSRRGGGIRPTASKKVVPIDFSERPRYNYTEEEKKQLPGYIERLCVASKLSKRALNRRLGLGSNSAVYNYVRGTALPTAEVRDRLIRMGEELGVSWTYPKVWARK